MQWSSVSWSHWSFSCIYTPCSRMTVRNDPMGRSTAALRLGATYLGKRWGETELRQWSENQPAKKGILDPLIKTHHSIFVLYQGISYNISLLDAGFIYMSSHLGRYFRNALELSGFLELLRFLFYFFKHWKYKLYHFYLKSFLPDSSNYWFQKTVLSPHS